MRVAPINTFKNPCSKLRNNTCNPQPCSNTVCFKGGECTKNLSTFFGFLGAFWGMAKTYAETGEANILMGIVCGLVGTLLGAFWGNMIDNIDIDEDFSETA